MPVSGTRGTPLSDLLRELRRLDARIDADGDQLTVSAPSGAVRDDLRAAMAARKAEIIAFLRDPHDPREDSVVSLFEWQVDATPDAPAVITAVPARSTDPRPLTYRELDRRANRLAQQLVMLGVGPSRTVGLLLDRSADFVIAAVATLKTGAAYVPIDPMFSREHQELLLVDAGIMVLITRIEPGMELPEARARVLCLKAWESELARRPDRRFGASIAPDAVACVLYPAEFTGKPEAGSVSHRTIVREAGSFELWRSLLSGRSLVLFPDLAEARPSGRLRRWNPAQLERSGKTPILASTGEQMNREEFAL